MDFKKYKTEIIDAITDYYFEFDYPYPEGDQFNSYKQSAEIETKNFSLDIEIEVLVRFINFEEYEVDEINIEEFILFDKEGNTIFNNDFDLWDDEITNNIQTNL